MLIVFSGLPGVGKTTIARALAQATDAVALDVAAGVRAIVGRLSAPNTSS